MNHIKTFAYLGGSIAGIATAGLVLPARAFATWNPDEIITNGNTLDPTTVSADSASDWVKTFTTWIVGIAVVFFVLRVVITAVDRMLFGTAKDGQISADTPLKKLPAFIKPYEEPWGEIFKKFAIQLAVCACAWLIVNLIAGAIIYVTSSLGAGGAAS